MILGYCIQCWNSNCGKATRSYIILCATNYVVVVTHFNPHFPSSSQISLLNHLQIEQGAQFNAIEDCFEDYSRQSQHHCQIPDGKASTNLKSTYNQIRLGIPPVIDLVDLLSWCTELAPLLEDRRLSALWILRVMNFHASAASWMSLRGRVLTVALEGRWMVKAAIVCGCVGLSGMLGFVMCDMR